MTPSKSLLLVLPSFLAPPLPPFNQDAKCLSFTCLPSPAPELACLQPVWSLVFQTKKDAVYSSLAPLDHIDQLSPFSELQTARNDLCSLSQAQESLANRVGKRGACVAPAVAASSAWPLGTHVISPPGFRFCMNPCSEGPGGQSLLCGGMCGPSPQPASQPGTCLSMAVLWFLQNWGLLLTHRLSGAEM